MSNSTSIVPVQLTTATTEGKPAVNSDEAPLLVDALFGLINKGYVVAATAWEWQSISKSHRSQSLTLLRVAAAMIWLVSLLVMVLTLAWIFGYGKVNFLQLAWAVGFLIPTMGCSIGCGALWIKWQFRELPSFRSRFFEAANDLPDTGWPIVGHLLAHNIELDHTTTMLGWCWQSPIFADRVLETWPKARDELFTLYYQIIGRKPDQANVATEIVQPSVTPMPPSPSKPKKYPACYYRAYDKYIEAVNQRYDIADMPWREIYDYVKNHFCEDNEEGFPANYQTFGKYVRAVKKETEKIADTAIPS
jgi:hypothetical protein